MENNKTPEECLDEIIFMAIRLETAYMKTTLKEKKRSTAHAVTSRTIVTLLRGSFDYMKNHKKHPEMADIAESFEKIFKELVAAGYIKEPDGEN